MKQKAPGKKRSVSVFLSQKEYDQLTEICKNRGQSRADFLRAAIGVHDQIPNLNTRPLTGACLQKHLDRLEREKNAAGRERRKKT